MVDIAIILPTEFYSVKSVLSPIPDNVKSKYDKLFSSHSCFTQTVHPLFDLKSRPIKPIHHSVRAAKTTNIKKQMVGLLNIINESNYPKIFNKIRMMINTQNIQYIITEILQKCCLQVLFLHVFVRLINSIINICDASEKLIIYNTINEYITSFINKKEYKPPSKTTEGSYDYFCFIQKHKAFITAKNMIILYLINIEQITTKKDKYLEWILCEINSANTELEVEILLQLLCDYKRMHRECEIQLDKKHVSEIAPSQRTRFILEIL